eukprot:354680-Rhodomonas_salina.3
MASLAGLLIEKGADVNAVDKYVNLKASLQIRDVDAVKGRRGKYLSRMGGEQARTECVWPRVYGRSAMMLWP